ncbi:MAG: hypothetical protein ACOX46_12630 [Limnochordia bacterium]|jgi:hypothetical protein
MMDLKPLIDRIEELGGPISFVEAERVFEESGRSIVGDYAYTIEGQNLLMWDNLSAEFVDALRVAINKGVIMPVMVPVSDYIAVGCVLQLPIAKNLDGSPFETEHWVPTFLGTAKTNPELARAFKKFKRDGLIPDLNLE